MKSEPSIVDDFMYGSNVAASSVVIRLGKYRVVHYLDREYLKLAIHRTWRWNCVTHTRNSRLAISHFEFCVQAIALNLSSDCFHIAAFIRKVYGILSAQLALTVLVSIATVSSETLQTFVQARYCM